jgi:hypothetical protein
MTSVLLGGSLVAIAPATSAFAHCPEETDYSRSGSATKVWLGTNLYSALVTGPGSIVKTFTKTSETSATASASFSVSAGVIASATAEVGVSLTSSSSYSQSWAYNIEIPSGTTARAHFFKEGYKIPTEKSVVEPTCTVSTSHGYTYAPVSSNSDAYYCDARDAGAITSIIQSTTCKPT